MTKPDFRDLFRIYLIKVFTKDYETRGGKMFAL